jgi:hyaluronan synthase
MSKLRATYNAHPILMLLAVLLAAALWATWEVWASRHRVNTFLRLFYLCVGGLSVVQLIAVSTASRHKPAKDLKRWNVAVIIPVYNEDASSLSKGIQSLFYQTRVPDEIHVVDDGSKQEYTALKAAFLKATAQKGIHASWTRQDNAGKRVAHATAMAHLVNRWADTIIVTLDSDGILDPKAIEVGLAPFDHDKVQSVAGLVVATNVKANLLSRIVDLLFVAQQQLIDREVMGRLKSVLVNSGGLAFYRLRVLDAAIENGYTNETFFGRHVPFSDDSYLTLFALHLGHTVSEPRAIVFADMPIKFSHHRRQQLRWMRGSFIRSWWRIRYLPLLSWGLARQLLGWILTVANTAVIVAILVVRPILTHQLPDVHYAVAPVLVAYMLSLRYLTVSRSDVSWLQRLGIFLLAPVATLWAATVLRVFRFYGAATCYKTGSWGTRQVTETVR